MLVSILGDSISTLEGYNPKGFSVFYDRPTQMKNGMKGPEDAFPEGGYIIG